MPVILNQEYTDVNKRDGAFERHYHETTVITAEIKKILDSRDQHDGIYTWIRGELEPSEIISNNIHLKNYAARKGLKFTLKTKANLNAGDVITLIGNIKQFTFKTGAYNMTIDAGTVIHDDFSFEHIERIMTQKRINKRVVKEVITAYKDDCMTPIEAILDIKRGKKSYHLSGLAESDIEKLQIALDTSDDKLAEAIVVSELLPYFGKGNKYPQELYKSYGFNAFEVVKRNPWNLVFELRQFGIRKADEVALLLGYDLMDPRRIRVIVRLAFKTYIDKSKYTYVPNEYVSELYRDHLQQYMSESEFDRIMRTELSKHIVKTELGYQTSELYDSEQQIYEGYKTLIQRNHGTLSDNHFKKIVKEKQADIPGFTFADQQAEAIRNSVESDFFILTGGPGTGKTTTLMSIIRAHQLHFKYSRKSDQTPVILLAPTGKAATRMTEQTGLPASTIHKQFLITSGGCRSKEMVLNQLQENGVRLVVIDEASMLDTTVAGTVFDLIVSAPHPIKLILVGDVNQLPSIGAGQVLSDLLQHTPYKTTLTEVKRQAGDSNIVTLAQKIAEGAFPDKDWFKGKDDVILMDTGDDKEALAMLRRLLESRIKYNDLDKFQTLTPYVNTSRQSKQRGEDDYDTCNMINHYTQEYFNSPFYDIDKADFDKLKELYEEDERHDGSKDRNIKRFVNNGHKVNGVRSKGRIFRINDYVVCNKNLTTTIANGSVGRIVQIGHHGSPDDIKQWSIYVAFDDTLEPHEFEYSDWDQISLAYALTIHKSQGSEYDNVFLMLTREPSYNDAFLNRNIVYTAVTRAKERLILIGKHANFVRAAINEQPQRETGLSFMLQHDRLVKLI